MTGIAAFNIVLCDERSRQDALGREFPQLSLSVTSRLPRRATEKTQIGELVARTRRDSCRRAEEKLGKERLKATFDGFLPSTQSLEREMQEIAAIIECTDRDFLVPSALKMLQEHGNREGLQMRFKEIMRLLGKA